MCTYTWERHSSQGLVYVCGYPGGFRNEPMFEIIAFDADDTLWENEIYYTQSKGAFVEQLSKYHEDRDWIEQRLDVIEEGNVDIYGYGIKSFTLSMVEAAIELSQGAIGGRELQAVIDLGRHMLSTPVQIFPHTEEVLMELSEKQNLMLITKGDVFEQSIKIERTGLQKYFHHIEIVGVKTTATYRSLFQRYRLDPRYILMVGNSLRSDILPMVELGGHAVYIPYANTWFHEHVDAEDLPHNGYYELEHIGQLPGLLRELYANERSKR